jgi:hypothetical protein
MTTPKVPKLDNVPLHGSTQQIQGFDREGTDAQRVTF